MTQVIVGALGFALGLAAHDLAIQGLTESRPLRPAGWRLSTMWTPSEAGSTSGVSSADESCKESRWWLWFQPSSPWWQSVSATRSTAGWILVPYLGVLAVEHGSPGHRPGGVPNCRSPQPPRFWTIIAAPTGRRRLVDRVGCPAPSCEGVGGAAAYFAGATLVWLAVKRVGASVPGM